MEDIFREGETALLLEHESSFMVKLDGSLARLKGARGGISTSRIIGMRVGDTLSLGSKKFLLLRPDIRDHIEKMERGPQIIIPKDASVIVSGLGLGDGYRVLEGGAGSGGLTMFLLNAVSPNGVVYTYDVRSDHLDLARSNIMNTGLDNNWEGKIGDITKGVDERDMDAAVLDIPDPDLAVKELATSLKIGARFCAYIPTANQMERVVLSLKKSGYVNIDPLEIIRRPYSVKEGATRPATEILAHTGFLVFARWVGSF
jgi:tRNA (adenine57-N1/adenine58-N1)-methyltransferase